MSPTDLTPLADLDGEDGAKELDAVLGRGLPPFAWDPSLPAPVSTLDPAAVTDFAKGQAVVVTSHGRWNRRGVVHEVEQGRNGAIVRVRLEVGDGDGLERGTTTIPLSCLADADEFDRAHPGLRPVFGRARA